MLPADDDLWIFQPPDSAPLASYLVPIRCLFVPLHIVKRENRAMKGQS